MAEFRRFRLDLDGASDSQIVKKLQDPPGYDASIAREQADGSLVGRKALTLSLAKRHEALMAMATSPVKQVGMMAFMMYMAGSQLGIFSIMATFNGLYQSITAIMNSGNVFVPDSERKLNVAAPRLLYCAIHAAALAFALYRIHLMGLLPTSMSDWGSALQAPAAAERAVQGMFGGAV